MQKEAQSRMNVLQQHEDVCGRLKGNEGYMDLWKEAQSRMNVLQQHEDVCGRLKGNEGYMDL